MAIVKPQSVMKIQIDIDGPDGNAFCLLGYAKQYARQLGLDYKKVQGEMTSGDYKNLINTFDHYFGEYVDLVTKQDL
jgi:hypothetical protein